MGPLTVLLAAAVFLSVAYLFTHAAAQSRGRAWREAAKRVGLTDVTTSDFLGIENGLSGRSGMLRVSLERYHRGKSEKGTRVVIDGLGHPSYEFALRKEGVGSAIEKAFGEREIELGDGRFDQRAYIHGAPRVVHAILDSETRDLVGEMIAGRIPTRDRGEPLKARVTVSDGALRAEIPERAFGGGAERLPGALAALLDAARRLTLPDDIPRRLAENVGTEPVAKVRLSNLLTLTREYQGYEATQDALRAACGDQDHEIRLRAAKALGEEGHPVLRAMAWGTDVADGRSARAVSALRRVLTREEATDLLRKALEAGRRVTARSAVKVLGQIGGRDVIEALATALEAEDDKLVMAAAGALGATGDPAAEVPLIAALDRDGPTIWPAIAEALGQVGTAAAVAPLRTMAGRFPFDLGLRRSSRQAIAEIQSRLTGATPGQLALADGGSGQLSLAEENTEGQVSMADQIPPRAEESSSASDGEEHWPTDGQESAGVPGDEGDERPAPHLPPKRETE